MPPAGAGCVFISPIAISYRNFILATIRPPIDLHIAPSEEITPITPKEAVEERTIKQVTWTSRHQLTIPPVPPKSHTVGTRFSCLSRLSQTFRTTARPPHDRQKALDLRLGKTVLEDLAKRGKSPFNNRQQPRAPDTLMDHGSWTKGPQADH